MKPSVGRVVHFVDASGKHRAGMITEVYKDDRVAICVFHPDMVFPPAGRAVDSQSNASTQIQHDEKTKEVFTWHWPERDE